MPYSALVRSRHLKAMTQESLSEASGVSLRTIQRAESGENIGLSTLKMLATALEVPVASIVSLNPVQESNSSELYEFVEEQIRQYRRRASWKYSSRSVFLSLFCLQLIVGSITSPNGNFFIIMTLAFLAISGILTCLIKVKIIEPYLDRTYPLTRSYEPRLKGLSRL